MQEHERSSEPSRPGIDPELTERLDRLTREDAERVLENAIRLHSQRRSAETFTSDQIRHIAHELGLDDDVVERAIRDELSGSGSIEERLWLVVSRIRKGTAVAGPRDEIHDRVTAWMENEEGLRLEAGRRHVLGKGQPLDHLDPSRLGERRHQGAT